jgi:hypothetical protein
MLPGTFNGIASFGSGQSLTSKGSTDIFIAVYKDSGKLLNAFREGGVTDDWANNIAIDAKGFIYLTGYYTGNANFNINGTTTLTSAGNADVYFLKAKRNSLQTNAAGISQESIVTIKANDELKVRLYQNMPNPVAGQTSIAYNLPAATKVRLSIMDMSGKEITIVKNAAQEKGSYVIQVNASALSNGIYIYRLETDDGIITKKMIVQR